MQKALGLFQSWKATARTTSLSDVPAAEQNDNPNRKDPQYYCVPLVLLVESSLFKIPRSYFEKHSDVFGKVYLLGPHGEHVSDGFTKEKPLRINGVDAAEFRCLLKAMVQEDSEDDMTWMQWISVLKLCQTWHMTLIEGLALRKLSTQIHHSQEWIAALKIATQLRIQLLRIMAIDKLTSQLGPVEKVQHATKYKIQSWLMQGCKDLVMRDASISSEEEQQLGAAMTSKIFHLRERRRERRESILVDIHTTFKCEFDDIAAFDTSPISLFRPNIRTTTDPDALQLDETYYSEDIILLVEDTLFKLPRLLLAESSEIFRDMFLLPTVEGIPHDGFSDEQPLKLEGIHKEHFRLLLKALKFPAASSSRASLFGRVTSTQIEEPMGWKEWTAVLELSCMWQMEKIRQISIQKILQDTIPAHEHQHLLSVSTKLAIGEIRDRAIQVLRLSSNISTAKRIQLGIQYQVDLWIRDGYRGLIEGQSSISAEVEGILGWETTSKLFRIREEYLKGTSGSTFVRDKIEEVFAQQLRDAVWSGSR